MKKALKLEGNVGKVIKKIDKVTASFSEPVIDRFCERLGFAGVAAAATAYSGNKMWYDDKVEVTYADRTLTASGESLMFQEFGTGLYQTKHHEKAAEFGFGPATYSEEHEQWLTDPKKWVIAERAGHPGEFPVGKTGLWTKGNDPAEGMTKAMDAMRAKIKEAWNDRH